VWQVASTSKCMFKILVPRLGNGRHRGSSRGRRSLIVCTTVYTLQRHWLAVSWPSHLREHAASSRMLLPFKLQASSISEAGEVPEIGPGLVCPSVPHHRDASRSRLVNTEPLFLPYAVTWVFVGFRGAASIRSKRPYLTGLPMFLCFRHRDRLIF
jgi:hypothetical protein